MPVTNSDIVIDNGSARNARSTWNVPTGSHENNVTTTSRSSAGFDSRSKKTSTADANDPNTIAVAR
jgi:hypothetical protein